jgi:hypothetical protein
MTPIGCHPNNTKIFLLVVIQQMDLDCLDSLFVSETENI